MADTFGDRLATALADRGPLCAGLDPSASLLHEWGRPLNADGLEYAARQVLDAVRDVVVAIKPQVAFFERFGAAGYRVLEKVLSDAREAELLVIADAKRGDIGTTNEGYAGAWLDETSPLRADALTVHPYCGLDALAALRSQALATSRGLFVLAATSNPEGRQLQRARQENGERVEDAVLATVASWNEQEEGRGSMGVVLGATRERPSFDLAQVRGPFLVPGVGAQGAGPHDVARLFLGVMPHSVVVNVSRALTAAGPESRAIRDAARRWRDDLRDALG